MRRLLWRESRLEPRLELEAPGQRFADSTVVGQPGSFQGRRAQARGQPGPQTGGGSDASSRC